MDQQDLKKALKQAQDMQEGLLKVQEELSHKVLEASSYDGIVDVTMSAQGDFRSLKINYNLLAIKYPSLPEACPVIEKAAISAIKRATEMATDLTKAKLKLISEGMGLAE
jgi:DNA-binding protein YbaB